MTTLAFLLWPDTFEDWYEPLGISRGDYLANYDGEWSTSLAGALVRGGIDVHLLYFTLGGELMAQQHPSGATAHFIPAPIGYRALREGVWGHRHWERTKRLWAAAPIASTLSARLLRSLTRLRPDAVVVQDYETLRYDVAAPLIRAVGLSVVAMDTGGSARPSDAPWKQRTLRLANRLLATHGAEARRLRALGHERVAVWQAPVRTDIFVPCDRAAARAELDVGHDEPVVFCAARLHPVKNLTLLADACADVGATLVVAGEGPQRALLERRGPGRVRLLGWQPTEHLLRWYAAADVVGLSSTQEGQPVAVLEAFACGRAVVATAVGGVPEVVRPGQTGWLVPPRGRADLSAALAKALADRETADRYGKAGRELVVGRHSPEAAASSFVRLVLP